MHKRYLWTDRRGADVYWPGIGNVDISATGKGSIAYWVSNESGASLAWLDQKLWRVWISESNYMASCFGRSVIVRSDGNNYSYSSAQIDNENRSSGWELHVTTWDFNTGVLKSYYDDAQPVNDPLTGVPAPQGTPSAIYVGPIYDNNVDAYVKDLSFYTVAIWDDEMTEEQIAALYAEGHRRRFQQADGTGNLTLLLTFDNGLDAEIAAGDGSWAQPDGYSADRFCLMEDGARELGRVRYPLGMPRHDSSEDDRKPLSAICPVLLDYSYQQTATSDINETNYSKLILSGYNNYRDAGAKFRNIPKPATYRQLIHIPDDSDQTPPQGYEMGLGPVAYKFYRGATTGVFDQMGSGRSFDVVADGSNSPTSFKTNISGTGWSGDDYWVGALLTFYTGNCTGRSLYVTDYDATNKIFTLETALPATPDTGTHGFVNFYPRVFGQAESDGERIREYAMEANLWAHHGDSKHFVELEWQQADNGVSILRYERGRSVAMPGCPWYYAYGGTGACYGKFSGDDGYYNQPGGTNLEIWLQKIEMDGPQQYQILRKDANGRGPALADNFTVLTRDRFGTAGDSVKIWRQQNLTFSRQQPTKITDWEAVMSDLEEAGTWRETVAEPGGSPVPVEYDEDTETIIAAIVGTDDQGTRRLGYVRGQWDDETGRLAWEDESPPAGKSNPVVDTASLTADYEQDAEGELWEIAGLLPALDGTWSLIYYSGRDSMDGTRLYALHGAPDRWSFDHATQFCDQAVPLHGGVDSHNPLTGHGFHQWANAHIYGAILRNPYAQDSRMRYIGLISAKTIYNSCYYYSSDVRPLSGVAGADVKSLASLPYSGHFSPLVGPLAHAINAVILGQEDSIAALIESAGGATGGVGMFTAEDGIHFQELFPLYPHGDALIPPMELPGEGNRLDPQASFRLGDKQIYYYDWGSNFNFAWGRYNGETKYELSEEQTAGYMETAILERPTAGWSELCLNLELNDGQLSVEVIDAETELPVAGYGQEDCDEVAAGLQHQVTWQAAGLSELTNEYLRLRFYFTRSAAEDASPQLCAWQMKTAEAQYPWVSDLRVEGEANPTNVSDTTPTLSWTYHHPENSPQSAYQIIVASSPDLLDENLGDLWDSGIVLSSDTSAVYAGTSLQDYTTYFWKVRVRSGEGAWSEQW